ncbi:hypothetical protein Tco_0100872 [Tanacetum coccineum]
MLHLSTHQHSTTIMQVEQTEPRNSVVPNRKPKDKPRLNKGAKRLFIKKQHHREIWKYHVCFTKRVGCCSRVRRLLKLIIVRAWIKSKNSLVKHFEDMRICRPSKDYLQVWFNPPREESMSSDVCQVTLVSMVDDEGRSRYAFHIIN